jgi:putative glutamine amidotransferase
MMSSMKTERRCVLVSQRRIRDPAHGEVRDALDVRWSTFLEAAGFVAIPLPSNADVEALLACTPGVVGIVLSGGGDVASALRENGVAADDIDLALAREQTEDALLRARPSLPVLAVCRGAQWLASRSGWRLVPLAGHVGSSHALVSVVRGASANGIQRALAAFDGVIVCSFHSLGLAAPASTSSEGSAASNELADPYEVALTSGGSVEALVHSSLRRVLVLWHPERHEPFLAADIELVRELFR